VSPYTRSLGLILLGVMTISQWAHARAPARSPGPPKLDLQLACAPLRSQRIRRILSLEVHAILAARIPGYRLRFDIRCSGGRLALRITAPSTGREARRELFFDPQRSDRERVVALAVSQLLLARLPTLIASRPRPRPQPGPRPPTRVRPSSPLTSVRKAPPRPGEKRSHSPGGHLVQQPTWRLAISGEVTALDLAHPLVVGGGGLRLVLALARRWDLTTDIRVVGGRCDRSVGRVSVLLPGADIGVRWRGLQRGRLTLSAGLRFGARYLWLRGEPADTHTGQIHHGPSAESMLELGIAWRVGRTKLGANLLGGVLLPGLIGIVTGDRDVRLAGVWLGLSVYASFALR